MRRVLVLVWCLSCGGGGPPSDEVASQEALPKVECGVAQPELIYRNPTDDGKVCTVEVEVTDNCPGPPGVWSTLDIHPLEALPPSDRERLRDGVTESIGPLDVPDGGALFVDCKGNGEPDDGCVYRVTLVGGSPKCPPGVP